MTQQALADAAGVHVNQVRRYEAGNAQPTLEALVGLARALHVSLDQLVFDEAERGPSDDLRLQFEAVSHPFRLLRISSISNKIAVQLPATRSSSP
ncbi:helix-turn-helix transcriptional regulator [Pelomonas sp. P8]|uniref:Helix-turn-helix transcriptional regulator n=1 Tax=Pelomonas cellulosilytica TaxID=2906762 RepID=A0ABS8XT49_9BURK|nr:helix-turn-helix transcriptional regulator [Pelomonas sp. P8]